MTIKMRSLIVGLLLAAASVLYGAARYYSPFIVEYVVEQTLIQKAPSGTDPVLLNSRFRALLSAAPSNQVKMERLLRISEYLEKVQSLTPGELEDLMAIAPGRSRS
jgi:hypothetical protein